MLLHDYEEAIFAQRSAKLPKTKPGTADQTQLLCLDMKDGSTLSSVVASSIHAGTSAKVDSCFHFWEVGVTTITTGAADGAGMGGDAAELAVVGFEDC